MVSLILISHSPKITEGVKDLAREMAKDAPIYAVGGNDDGGLGSSYERIKEAIGKAIGPDGAIILYDLGSSVMTATVVLDELDEETLSRIKVSKAPLVEGAIVAAVGIDSGQSLDDIYTSLKEIEMTK